MKGRSYGGEQWKSFEKGQHSFTEEGFVHDKAFSFNARLEKDQTGVGISQSIIEKTQGLSGTGQVDFWFTLDTRRAIFARVGSVSNLQLQFDNGVGALKGINQNIYGGIEVNRSLTERTGKIGVELFGKEWSFNNRLVYSFTKRCLSLDQKGWTGWRGWRFNGYINTEFENRLIFNKTGLLLSWDSKNGELGCFAKLERNSSDKKTLKFFFETLKIGCSSSITPSQIIGLEAKLSLFSSQILQSAWLTSQWRFGDRIVKARVNKDFSQSLSIKNKLGNYGEYSLGMQVTEVGTKNRFKFGTQIDLNL